MKLGPTEVLPGTISSGQHGRMNVNTSDTNKVPIREEARPTLGGVP